jgi:predicted amidohydrolase YtcJ
VPELGFHVNHRNSQEDLVLEFGGGTILTLDPARPRVEALTVRGGRILAMGGVDHVERGARGKVRRIDLGGRCLLPGFVDHHIHMLNIGFSLANDARGGALFMDLARPPSEEWIAERVAARAREQAGGQWLLGTGWSQNGWAMPAMPTHHRLTEAAPLHPVILARVDVHSAWVNQAALAEAGIGAGSPEPSGGQIVRLADGSPSGILVDRAYEPILARTPRPDDDLVREAFRRAADNLAARGFTRIYEAGFLEFPGLLSLGTDQEKYLELLIEEDAREPLPVEVNLMIMAPSDLAEKVVTSPERYRRLSPRIGVTHLKLHADGALGSRGALLSEPYYDAPCACGLFRTSPEVMRGWVERGLAAGLDIATHAIGDRANAVVLDVYEEALRTRPDVEPRRLRVEHFTFATREDMQRAARLGVVLAVQPNFVEPDEHGHVMEDIRLGPERAALAYAFGDLHRMGARLAGSTDDYTYVPNAVRNFFAAATRRTPIPGCDARWQPEQRLTRDESLRLLCRWYRPGGGEPEPGILAEGGRATFAVLSGDPLMVPEDDILGLQVCATVVDGRRTFDDGSLVERRRRSVTRRRPPPRRVALRSRK